jgi:hypothetical protein
VGASLAVGDRLAGGRSVGVGVSLGLGDRLAGGRSVGVEGGCATVGVGLPQADRKVTVSNAKMIFSLDR